MIVSRRGPHEQRSGRVTLVCLVAPRVTIVSHRARVVAPRGDDCVTPCLRSRAEGDDCVTPAATLDRAPGTSPPPPPPPRRPGDISGRIPPRIPSSAAPAELPRWSAAQPESPLLVISSPRSPPAGSPRDPPGTPIGSPVDFCLRMLARVGPGVTGRRLERGTRARAC
eukprot:1187273-Prorocentrum_minimum.AAC.1